MQPDPRMAQRPPEPTWWWFLVPLFTCGYGTFLMVLIGGRRLRSRFHTIAAFGYLAATLGLCAGVSFYSSSRSQGQPDSEGTWVVALLMLIYVVGIVHTAVVASRVRWAAATGPTGPQVPVMPYPVPMPQEDPALAAARWRARRREEARQLQASQPALASELLIGRPDLPHRQYDDGGLIDVNHVSAEWIAGGLQLDLSLADQIVAAREARGGFSTPDELVVYCDGITPERLALFRDRLIFIPR
ncbi:hypothetical protein BJY16_000030 [Actinoplanes octamycinicus]|uniref:Helix-hairpin-helix protein n=1 Tax=Actinoplanes octamycinicus TaxID=135948 RepID=A0A7W7GQZ3_9ACTN|nr:hypothetical protein [Actinoplanes octamycinicus]MBB4736571.1 hypothetical protein [Actinoplanes octamycinicus]GIE62935.1 hypothetical protein Aoc01nite_83370 [Actinoplanes octamycinicus]